MLIRPAAPTDLDGTLAVYKSARAFMREAGNPDQWGDGFPPRELVEQDIAAGVLRVCMGENDGVLGCFAFLPGPEPDYARIYEGAWPNDEPYDVVHRFAVLRQGQGVGGAMLDWALEHGRNLRVDTHRDNRPMQGLLLVLRRHQAGPQRRRAPGLRPRVTAIACRPTQALAARSLAVFEKSARRFRRSRELPFSNSDKEREGLGHRLQDFRLGC